MVSMILFTAATLIIFVVVGTLFEISKREQRRQAKLALAFDRARKARLLRGEHSWSPTPPTRQ